MMWCISARYAFPAQDLGTFEGDSAEAAASAFRAALGYKSDEHAAALMRCPVANINDSLVIRPLTV